MRLVLIAVVLVVVLTVVLGLWRAGAASRRGLPGPTRDPGDLADLALRCREVVANLDYVTTLPTPGSPLAEPVQDLADELRVNVLQVEKATIQLGRHPVSEGLRAGEVARLGHILDAAESASTELAALTVHGLSDPRVPMERVRVRVVALHAALEEIRRPYGTPPDRGAERRGDDVASESGEGEGVEEDGDLT